MWLLPDYKGMSVNIVFNVEMLYYWSWSMAYNMTAITGISDLPDSNISKTLKYLLSVTNLIWVYLLGNLIISKDTEKVTY